MRGHPNYVLPYRLIISALFHVPKTLNLHIATSSSVLTFIDIAVNMATFLTAVLKQHSELSLITHKHCATC